VEVSVGGDSESPAERRDESIRAMDLFAGAETEKVGDGGRAISVRTHNQPHYNSGVRLPRYADVCATWAQCLRTHTVDGKIDENAPQFDY
jgi:hypothetical protein